MSELTALEKLALELFDVGAVRFDGPFKFKIHEKYPDFPLSPNKIDLRTPDNGGNLTPELVAQIGYELWKRTKCAGLQFDLVAGLPRAGESLAEAVAKFARRPLVKLLKKEEKGRRCIHSVVEDNYQPGQRVLVIDDVMSQGLTKIEGIARLEKPSLRIAAILVFVDREEGGSEYIQSFGYRVFSVYTLSNLMKFYHRIDKISRRQLEKSLAYSWLAKQLFLKGLP